MDKWMQPEGYKGLKEGYTMIEKKREIKFRGKLIPDDNNESEWVYGNLSVLRTAIHRPYNLTETGSYISNEGGMPFAYHVTPESVGQFIGLKDKNDKEIYEGDFLQDEYNRILLVEWWQYAFTLKAITKTNFVRANYIIQWFIGVPSLPEIIGNIYENPELLEPDTLCACKEVKEQDENTPEKR